MKIHVIVLTLVSILTSPAYAADTTGAKATALRKALLANGAQIRAFVETSHLSVSDVRCSTVVTGQDANASCEMKDDNNGKIIRVRDQADSKKTPVLSLVMALRNAGASVEESMGITSIDARSVSCTVGYMHGPINSCVVK